MKLTSYLFAIAVFFCATAASAHTPSDPNFLRPDSSKNWKTLTTAHFRIHHESSQKEFAQQMAAVAERVHNKLSTWLGWIPEEKTEIVILDSVDYSNGAATPLPYNQFYIYMPTPTEGEILDQNPWMEYVFTHEYVHILHLDMAYDLPKEIRDVLGRPLEFFTVATFPQLFAPSWVTEGLAVYGESNNAAGYGRLNNAWYDMEMRMEVQRGLRSLSEISYEGYSGSRWPSGSNYLYGAYFFKFINDRYGRDKVIKYIKVYGNSIFPWRMDLRSERVFGKPSEQVWDEYRDYLRHRFQPRLAQLKQQQTGKSQILFDTPYYNNSITSSGTGDLYFYHNDSSSLPQVKRLRTDGTNETLFEIEGVIGMDWNDHAGLLLNKMAVCDNTKLFAELYRWKPGMSAPTRMTECGRYVHAAWRPDGQQIAAVQLDQNLSRLVLLDANGEHPEQLSQLAAGDTLGQLGWSPDGSLLVASVKRQSTGWNLETFSLKERKWQQLTLNNELKIRPRFSRDGKNIYFISDHDKVWNLRSINLADKSITTLSHSISGIMEAVAMPDDSYRLVEYTPHGEALNKLLPDSHTEVSYESIASATPKITAIVNEEGYRPVPYDNVQDYSALDTLRPRSWVPFLVGTNQSTYAGVSLYSADVLGFHQWSAAPYIYASPHALGGYASYHYLNTLTLFANRQLFLNGNNNDPTQYISDEVRYQALLHHSFNSMDRSIYLAGGISSERVTDSLKQNGGVFSVTQNVLTGLVARYDNTEFYQRSTSLSDGRNIKLVGESYDIMGSNSYTGKAYQLDWKEYIGLGASHVLYLRALMASGDAGIRPYNLGGDTETIVALDGTTDLGQRRFMLRGYPTGLATLTGTQLGLFTAEWRIPLGLNYDGWLVPPVGLGKHSLSVFVDSGDAWNKGQTTQLKTGAGIAWNTETLIGFDMLHVGLTVGVARGMDQGGESQLYLMLGSPF